MSTFQGYVLYIMNWVLKLQKYVSILNIEVFNILEIWVPTKVPHYRGALW